MTEKQENKEFPPSNEVMYRMNGTLMNTNKEIEALREVVKELSNHVKQLAQVQYTVHKRNSNAEHSN